VGEGDEGERGWWAEQRSASEKIIQTPKISGLTFLAQPLLLPLPVFSPSQLLLSCSSCAMSRLQACRQCPTSLRQWIASSSKHSSNQLRRRALATAANENGPVLQTVEDWSELRAEREERQALSAYAFPSYAILVVTLPHPQSINSHNMARHSHEIIHGSLTIPFTILLLLAKPLSRIS
jgi:hypothetical protein